MSILPKLATLSQTLSFLLLVILISIGEFIWTSVKVVVLLKSPPKVYEPGTRWEKKLVNNIEAQTYNVKHGQGYITVF